MRFVNSTEGMAEVADETMSESIATEVMLNATMINSTETERMAEFITLMRSEIFVEIIIYLILFTIGSTCNLWVFYNHMKTDSMPRMNFLLKHLTFADLLVVFVTISTEIIWRLTVTWNLGSTMCKFISAFKVFGLYLSSNIIICISLDRYFAFVRPISSMDWESRNRRMVIVSYIMSALMSFPQAVMFHIEHHPDLPAFTQCVTSGYFKEEWKDSVYNISTLFGMYFVPLLFIVYCYLRIIVEMSKSSDQFQDYTQRNRLVLMEKARRKSLWMSFALVVTFILCWSPYAFYVIWYQVDKESVNSAPDWIKLTFFAFAVSSSCFDPLVHSQHFFVGRTRLSAERLSQSRNRFATTTV